MSIRGIDAQIMITRSAEFSRENSALQTRPEVNQQQLAEQNKVSAAHDSSRVTQMEESETDAMRTEEDGSGNNSYEGGGAGGGQLEGEDITEETRSSMLVPPIDHVLDITI